MILSDGRKIPVGRTAPRVLLVLGMLSLPFLPAAASGDPPRAPAQESAAPKKPAVDKPAERPSPPSAVAEPAIDKPKSNAETPETKPSPPDRKIRVKASRPIRREVTDTVFLNGRRRIGDDGGAPPPGQRHDRRGRPASPGRRSGRGNFSTSSIPGLTRRSWRRPRPRSGLPEPDSEARRCRGRMGGSGCRSRPRRNRQGGPAPAESKVDEASLQAAEKALEIARINLAFTRLESPIDGTILGPVVQAGNVAVADNTTLATIVSTDPMYVYFEVPERHRPEAQSPEGRGEDQARAGQRAPGRGEPTRRGRLRPPGDRQLPETVPWTR